MTVKELLEEAAQTIPYPEGEWLLSFFLECGFADLQLKLSDPLDEETKQQFLAAVAERNNGKPLQYIVKEAEFFGLKLFVNEHVLIPRPETEELVELFFRANVEDPERILDLGTGSGAIALSVKEKCPDVFVGASDISHLALSVAERNALNLKLDVKFREGFLLNPWQDLLDDSIIIANLPYVDKNDPGLMPEVKKWEPLLALIPQEQNRSTLKLQAAWLVDELLQQILEANGKVAAFYLELSPPVIKAIQEKWQAEEFPYDLESKEDLRGKLRFLVGKRK